LRGEKFLSEKHVVGIPIFFARSARNNHNSASARSLVMTRAIQTGLQETNEIRFPAPALAAPDHFHQSGAEHSGCAGFVAFLGNKKLNPRLEKVARI